MSPIEDLMAVNRTKQLLASLDELKAVGEKLIAGICTTGARLFPNQFSPTPNGTTLRFTFYGIELLTRVELAIHGDELPRVSTYVVDQHVPPQLEKLDMDLNFDSLGNINNSMTIEDAAPKFLPTLMKQLGIKKISLLP